MTRTIDVKEAETQLSHLLALALQGDEIIIEQNGEPKVRLAPIERQTAAQRELGGNRGWVEYMSEDFNAPLPDEFWIGEKDEGLA